MARLLSLKKIDSYGQSICRSDNLKQPTGERMSVLTLDARKVSRVGRLRMRSGFTLVELLTVIAIIGMLGAISITTTRSAVQSAREAQTRTTIAKIDSVLTGIYEKYQYRRPEVSNGNATQRAYDRVLKIRDLLRCDMPCTLKEVNAPSLFNQDITGGENNRYYTPLQNVYRFEINNANGSSGFPNINAELLYLVVMNADPEARTAFSDREIADVDNNGLYEFVDGWGNPIRWMRWAPGLLTSDRQPRCYAGVDEVKSADADPFDPLDIIQTLADSGGTDKLPGWFLVPYVYSAGPDGEYGLLTPEDLESRDSAICRVLKVFGLLTTQELESPDVSLGYDMNDPFTFSRNNRLKTLLNTIEGKPFKTIETIGSPGVYADDETVEASTKYKDNIDNHTLVR